MSQDKPIEKCPICTAPLAMMAVTVRGVTLPLELRCTQHPVDHDMKAMEAHRKSVSEAIQRRIEVERAAQAPPAKVEKKRGGERQ